MTCIVGLVDRGTVYVGGDSAAVGGLSIETRADPKVFVRDGVIIGYTSSFRMGQLLQYALQIPEQSARQTDMAYLVTTFADAVRALYRERGFMGKVGEREDGGTFLLGYRGRLYKVADDFQVAQVAHPYDAVGCGGELALGALYATADCGLDPEARIRVALAAAAEFSAGVRPPFHVLRLPSTETS